MAAIGAMMAGCQSGSRALTPYGRDIDSICHCQERSGALERPEPLVFWAWWCELTRALYADEMGEAFRGEWLARAPFVMAVLAVLTGEARRVGLPACPLADVWSAPPAP